MQTVTRPLKALLAWLHESDGKMFDAYGHLLGDAFAAGSWEIRFVHIQGSPGADPASVCHLRLSRTALGLPDSCLRSAARRMATADYLLRAFGHSVHRYARQNRGAQGSGSFQPLSMPPQVLRRNVVEVGPCSIRIAIRISLPGSRDNRIRGRAAARMFGHELPKIVRGLMDAVLQGTGLERHCSTIEDMIFLQDRLDSLELVAFVGDGAILPRRSGGEQWPLAAGAVPFVAPAPLAVTVDLPNAGRVRGMGIRRGVTVLIGGAFHGKSTLLDALAKAVYPHIPGDGRERVVAHRDSAFVCAEEGRAVHGLDISSFVHTLPGGVNPRQFWTNNASGSTSQAAGLIESVLAGAKLLLVDEDSSATNFLIKDQNMRRLIPEETITPFFDRVQELYDRFGVSTLIVVGGSSQYLSVAHQVIAMQQYRPVSMLAEVAHLSLPEPQTPAVPMTLCDGRRLRVDNFDPAYHARRLAKTIAVRIKPLRLQERILEYGNRQLDLTKLVALVDPDQVLTLGYALHWAKMHCARAFLSPTDLALRLSRRVREHGLDILGKEVSKAPFLALPRRLELAGAINRLRGLRVDVVDSPRSR